MDGIQIFYNLCVYVVRTGRCIGNHGLEREREPRRCKCNLIPQSAAYFGDSAVAASCIYKQRTSSGRGRTVHQREGILHSLTMYA